MFGEEGGITDGLLSIFRQGGTVFFQLQTSIQWGEVRVFNCFCV
ncbi:MAG: hypothetical protein MAG581_02468 [Deltaproteobacteria bacterium]|nr:hypothetical protein [Deltaproteobacteria bacterium]